jgi:AcrR family transcriptional regulator
VVTNTMPPIPDFAADRAEDPSHRRKISRQARSERSAELALAATCELLRERDFANFTLDEVSKRAKVSIGSIINRFAFKDNLVRTAMLAALEEYDADERYWIEAAIPKAASLRAMVMAFVEIAADAWSEHSVALKSAVHFSGIDEQLRRRLDEQAEQAEETAIHALLQFRSEFGIGDAQNKARFVNNFVRSVISSNIKHRQPLVPMSTRLSAELKWELVDTCVAYLTSDHQLPSS